MAPQANPWQMASQRLASLHMPRMAHAYAEQSDRTGNLTNNTFKSAVNAFNSCKRRKASNCSCLNGPLQLHSFKFSVPLELRALYTMYGMLYFNQKITKTSLTVIYCPQNFWRGSKGRKQVQFRLLFMLPLQYMARLTGTSSEPTLCFAP